MQPSVLISSSLAVGLLAGVAVHWEDFSATKSVPTDTSETIRTDSSLANSRTEGVIEDPAASPLRGQSESEAFSGLSAEQQKTLILKLSSRFTKGADCSDQLLLAKAVNELDYERAKTLWESITKTGGQRQDPTDAAHKALGERLAALDPTRALELGKASEDPSISKSAILAIAQRNGADAIRALAQLPEKFQKSVSDEMMVSFTEGVGKASGTLAEITAALKADPQIINPKSQSERAVRRLIGQVASQAAAADPERAMGELRQMAAALVSVKPGEDPKAAESALVARIAAQMTQALRSDAPNSARAVFNALADSEKNATMVALEASARFRENGTETAIQFAEKQTSPQLSKEAARGVWWSIANQDRGAAMRWIESLPQGPFRDGALNSVMQEAGLRTRTLGQTEEALKAGAELLSLRSKVDYFAALAQQRRGDSSSQSEFISNLPLPEPEKLELRRRLAPIPLK
jgi:hypothetical protein